jgi:hypothetical protein
VNGDEGCVVRRRTAAGTWEPEVMLRTPQAIKDQLAEPGVTVISAADYCMSAPAVDGSGRAIALVGYSRYLRDDASGETFDTLHVLRVAFDPATGWEPGELFGGGGPLLPPPYPTVAMNGEGAAVIAWVDDDTIRATRRAPGGSWSEPVLVHSAAGSNPYLYRPKVVLDAAGNGLALWSRRNLRVQGARLEGGVWSPAVTLDGGPGTDSSLWDVAMNAGGEAILVWRQCDDAGVCAMRVRRFDPDSGWQAPVDLAPAGTGGSAAVAIDPAGDALAVWSTSWPNEDGDDVSTLHAARLTGGVWSAPEEIAIGAARDEIDGVQAVVDDAGRGLVVWAHRFHDDEPCCGDTFDTWFRARRFAMDGGFDPVMDIDLTREGNSHIRLAMNAAGAAMALWFDYFDARAQSFPAP